MFGFAKSIAYLLVWQRGNDEVARRLMTIPGIGPVGATALAASVTDPHQFRSRATSSPPGWDWTPLPEVEWW